MADMDDLEPRIEPRTLSIPDAATALGVAPSTFRLIIKDGDIPTVRIRGRRMVRTADLDAYVAGLDAA